MRFTLLKTKKRNLNFMFVNGRERERDFSGVIESCGFRKLQDYNDENWVFENFLNFHKFSVSVWPCSRKNKSVAEGKLNGHPDGSVNEA